MGKHTLYCGPAYTTAGYEFDSTRKPEWITAALSERPVANVTLAEPEPVPREVIETLHDSEYVNAVMSGEPGELAESNCFTWDSGVWTMVTAQNGGAISAALSAMEDGGNSTFVTPVFSRFEVTIWVPDFCDVSPRTRRTLFLRAEWVVCFGCCQMQGCTAKWLRREVAVWGCRSRRPRRMRVCGAGATRIHQTGMEEPAIGAAATERWSVRGPGMRHGVVPLTASELESLIKLRRARRSPANASLQIRTGPERSEPGADAAEGG